MFRFHSHALWRIFLTLVLCLRGFSLLSYREETFRTFIAGMDNELNSGNMCSAMNRRSILVHFSQELQVRVARLAALPLQSSLPLPPPLEQQPSPQLAAVSLRTGPPPVHRSPSHPRLKPRPPSVPPPPPPPSEKKPKTRPHPCIIPPKGNASGRTGHYSRPNAHVRPPLSLKSTPWIQRSTHVQWAKK